MDKKLKELSKYRLNKAKENLDLSIRLIDSEDYDFAANRAYYSIFDGLRAVNALNNFDSSKHAGVIAYFNENFVKTGHFELEISKAIKLCYKLREKSDYEDFYITTKKDAVIAVENAKKLINDIEKYLKNKYKDNNI